MADTLTLKEVELDYEADEAEDRAETPPVTPRDETATPTQGQEEDEEGEEKDDQTSNLPPVETDEICSPQGDMGEELEEGEKDDDDESAGELSAGELEDGEISDEDETLKNERLEPKPVCRFFSKGQCTWGQSCRFLHPGVLDKGNYSMFAAPRPILPGEPDVKEPVISPVKQVMVAPPVPAHESAWERGLRQAKEMRRRSNKRREMDVEYEEKKASLSLTQVELDKENDYYMRPASPAHTHDPYAEDYDPPSDPYDTFHPETSRRIAPPPPPEFIAREERERSSRYSHSPPPRVRRIAPPRSPDPGRAGGGGGGDPGHHQGPPDFPPPRNVPPPGAPPPHQAPRGGGPSGAPGRFRGGEDWADPWMRGGPEKKGGGGGSGGRAGRRRSYSSGSSRSSSGSSRSRSPRRKRRYSSSFSSHSSSRSRSRSSSPGGIPRKRSGPERRPGGAAGAPGSSVASVKREQNSRNTAPLQKRLAAVAGQVKVGKEGRKPEERGERKRTRDSSSEEEGLPGSSSRSGKPHVKSRSGQGGVGGEQVTKKEVKQGSTSKDHKQERERPSKPFKMSLPKNQIKLTLKTAHTTKPANQTVLEKLGMTNDDLAEAKKAMKRKADLENTEAAKKQKIKNMELMEALKERLKHKVEASTKVKPAETPAILPAAETPVVPDESVEAKGKDPKKIAKPKTGGGDAKGRREELLKQLKAVEDAIHRKRTKLDG